MSETEAADDLLVAWHAALAEHGIIPTAFEWAVVGVGFWAPGPLRIEWVQHGARWCIDRRNWCHLRCGTNEAFIGVHYAPRDALQALLVGG